jgi:hypothetical protein
MATRYVKAGTNNAIDLTVFFQVKMPDFLTPALNELGGQPQINVNGTGWQLSNISPLVSLGYGNYSATLNQSVLAITGTVVETLYQGVLTAASPGDIFIVVDPNTGLLPNIPLYDAYATTPEGDLYFSQRLNSNTWLNAVFNDKRNSLRQATRLIDRLNFVGDLAVPGQILQFPRSYSQSFLVNNVLTNIITVDPNGVPVDIKNACFEIAYKLLDGVDVDMEIDLLFATNRGYSTVRSSYDPLHIPDYLRNGIPSALAWTYLLPYLRDPNEIRVSRVN